MPKVKTPKFSLHIGVLNFFDIERLRQCVTEIEVEMLSDGASAFKVLLDDGSDEFAAGILGTIREGDSCTIGLGYYETGVKQLITGIVTGVKSQRKEYTHKIFTVTGFDGLQALTRGRQRRSWEKIKDSDIAAQIAGECGLGIEADDSKIIHPYVVQNNENNLAFLYERARRIGFEVKVEGRKLIFKKPLRLTTCKTLRWSGLNADWDTLILQRCDFNSTTMNVPDKVVVRSYDPKSAKPIIAVNGSILGGTMGGKETGAALAQRNNPSTTIQISDQPVVSQEEADLLAESIMNQRSGEYLTGQGSCEGHPDVVCGRAVTLLDLGPELDGQYYVTKATHKLKVGHGAGFGYWLDFAVSRSGH